MGWLFGKKKPRVPFPEGRPFDEKALQFPKRTSYEEVIEPENIKAAVGLSKPMAFPDEEMPEERETKNTFWSSALPKPTVPDTAKFKPRTQPLAPGIAPETTEPLFVKMEVYQKIIGELDGLKKNISEVAEHGRHLESSEYNEEKHFVTLKTTVRLVHDRMLQVDKIIFKGD